MCVQQCVLIWKRDCDQGNEMSQTVPFRMWFPPKYVVLSDNNFDSVSARETDVISKLNWREKEW